MEINFINDLSLYTSLIIFFITVFGVYIYKYKENKRLEEKYPLYTKSQRFFMLHTVEHCDKKILCSLMNRYDEKRGKITSVMHEVQRSKDHLVIHISYCIPSISVTSLVIFDSNKTNSFIHDHEVHKINFMQTEHIPAILL